MKITETAITDVKIIEPELFHDERGGLFESFNQRAFEKAMGRSVHFVQDNHSYSHKGVLRGLHYQLPPYTQAKLVRVVRGEVFDVVVDIRRSSPSFGKWVGVFLSSDNHRQVWIPEGFAHGFMALSPLADVVYKTTDYYAPEYERGIVWNDPALNIDWQGTRSPILSDKDVDAPLMADAELFT